MQRPSTYPYLLGSTECPQKGKERVFNEPQLHTLDLHLLPKCDPYAHLPMPPRSLYKAQHHRPQMPQPIL